MVHCDVFYYSESNKDKAMFILHSLRLCNDACAWLSTKCDYGTRGNWDEARRRGWRQVRSVTFTRTMLSDGIAAGARTGTARKHRYESPTADVYIATQQFVVRYS